MGIPTATVKRNLRIESDSEHEEEELAEEAYDRDSEVSEYEGVPEVSRHIYRMDNCKWNIEKRSSDEIYKFNEEKYFLFNFQNTLRMSSNDNADV